MLRVLASTCEQVMHALTSHHIAVGSKVVTPTRASIIWPYFMHSHSVQEFWASTKSFRTLFQESCTNKMCFVCAIRELRECYDKWALSPEQHLACWYLMTRFCGRYRKPGTHPGRSWNRGRSEETALFHNVMCNTVNLGWVAGRSWNVGVGEPWGKELGLDPWICWC